MSSRKTVLLLASWLAFAFAARAEIKVGAPFPALASAGLVGDLPATEGKVVLVDFCASWCAPCKASFPTLGKLARDYAAKGVVVVGVSIDEKADAYASFVKKMAAPFPVVHDRAQKLVRAVEVPTMPTTYIIGRDGKVAAVHPGYRDGAEQELRKLIDAALAPQS